MNHPELLLLPAFMLADYYLTVLGASLKEKKYSQHFQIEHYELNPIWQQAIAQRKWFNPRHILLTIISSSILVWLVEFGDMPEAFIEGLTGFLFGVFGMIIGRHLSNLLTFRYLIRQPNEITGQVAMAHAFALSLSMFQMLPVLGPLALIALFAPSPFVIGALTGLLVLSMAFRIWRRRYRRKAEGA